MNAETFEQLVRTRDRMQQELNTLNQLIADIRSDEAATRRQMRRFELGEQLGATKLARLLGCSRGHAIKGTAARVGDRLG